MSKQKKQQKAVQSNKAEVKKKSKASAPPFPDWRFLERHATKIVIGLTLIAFFIRVYRVGFLTLWVDEFRYVMDSLRYLDGGNLLSAGIDGVAVTAINTVIFKIFGFTELSARMVSVIFGAATIPMIYILGKRLFNTPIGIFSAVLATFSMYLIFWSRVVKVYSLFTFLFIILILVSLYALKVIDANYREEKGFFKRWELSKRHVLILPVLFVLSLLNAKMTLYLLFILAAYCSFMALGKIISWQPRKWWNKYSLVFYPTVILLIVFLTPLKDVVVKPTLTLILPERVVNWIMPEWGRLSEFMKDTESTFKVFKVYWNVLKTDYPILYVPALLGFILAFFLNKTRALFVITGFVVPFLLLSFVLREVWGPRYIMCVYPFFLVGGGVAIYFVIQYIVPRVLPRAILAQKILRTVILIAFFGVVGWSLQVPRVTAYINSQAHGRVVPAELSIWYFTDWRTPCHYVDKVREPDDILISTYPDATTIYLNTPSLWFRQMYLDGKARKHLPMPPDTLSKFSAKSVDGLIKAISENPRGWCLMDYYFYNVYTDPKARDYIVRNLKYHFTASSDGHVNVFSWDNTQPKEPPKSFLMELGKEKANSSFRSFEVKMTFPELKANVSKVKIMIDCEGVNRMNEAILVINKKKSYYLPPGKGVGRETIELELPKSEFVTGENIFGFGANPKVGKDQTPGFAIYNITARWMP